MDTTEFKKKFSFKDRLDQAERIKRRYPNRVPIIVNTGEGVPKLDKQKYLVPRDLKASEFMCIIRKRITISAKESIYMFFNKKMVVSWVGQCYITYPLTGMLLNSVIQLCRLRTEVLELYIDGYLYRKDN